MTNSFCIRERVVAKPFFILTFSLIYVSLAKMEHKIVRRWTLFDTNPSSTIRIGLHMEGFHFSANTFRFISKNMNGTKQQTVPHYSVLVESLR